MNWRMQHLLSLSSFKMSFTRLVLPLLEPFFFFCVPLEGAMPLKTKYYTNTYFILFFLTCLSYMMNLCSLLLMIWSLSSNFIKYFHHNCAGVCAPEAILQRISWAHVSNIWGKYNLDIAQIILFWVWFENVDLFSSLLLDHPFYSL